MLTSLPMHFSQLTCRLPSALRPTWLFRKRSSGDLSTSLEDVTMNSQSDSRISEVDLPFTLYLNQRLTFDALASLENGFSQFSTVSTTSSETGSNEKSAEAHLGSGNTFAILGIEFGGSGRLTTGHAQADTESRERQIIHTPASLFARLRKELKGRDMVHVVSKSEHLENIRPGVFVEFEASLHRNPLEDFLTSIVSLVPIMTTFDPSAQNPSRKGRGKGSSGRRNQEAGQYSQIEKQAHAILSLLTSEAYEYTDLIAETDDIRTVITAERKYFIDPTLNDVIDGTFRIFGKVTRVIPRDGQEQISLMRKTTLGKFGDTSASLGGGMFKAVADTGFAGAMEDRIGAPAMQIIPLAIFA